MRKLAIILLSMAAILSIAAGIVFAITRNPGAIGGCVVLLIITVAGIGFLKTHPEVLSS